MYATPVQLNEFAQIMQQQQGIHAQIMAQQMQQRNALFMAHEQQQAIAVAECNSEEVADETAELGNQTLPHVIQTDAVFLNSVNLEIDKQLEELGKLRLQLRELVRTAASEQQSICAAIEKQLAINHLQIQQEINHRTGEIQSMQAALVERFKQTNTAVEDHQTVVAVEQHVEVVEDLDTMSAKPNERQAILEEIERQSTVLKALHLALVEHTKKAAEAERELLQAIEARTEEIKSLQLAQQRGSPEQQALVLQRYQQLADYHASMNYSSSNLCCRFCLRNGEHPSLTKTHNLRNAMGLLTCPVLRIYVCPICQSTGDQAHTITYCPMKPFLRNPQGNGTRHQSK